MRERNAPVEAAETFLDSLQLARFWSASGKGENRIQALLALDPSLGDLRDILTREPLSRDQLQRMAQEFETLEAAWRSPPSYLELTLARWAEGAPIR
jgi:hypothetical protein